MILKPEDFTNPNRVKEIAIFIKRELNISDGSDIILLMKDSNAKSNLEAIEKWTRQKVWSELREVGSVELDLLSNDLLIFLRESQEQLNWMAF